MFKSINGNPEIKAVNKMAGGAVFTAIGLYVASYGLAIAMKSGEMIVEGGKEFGTSVMGRLKKQDQLNEDGGEVAE